MMCIPFYDLYNMITWCACFFFSFIIHCYLYVSLLGILWLLFLTILLGVYFLSFLVSSIYLYIYHCYNLIVC